MLCSEVNNLYTVYKCQVGKLNVLAVERKQTYKKVNTNASSVLEILIQDQCRIIHALSNTKTKYKVTCNFSQGV